jgi:hypothetical protein
MIFTCCHPGALARRAGRAHAARSVRVDHRGDRARVPDAGTDARASESFVRRRRFRDARFRIRCPTEAELPDRLDCSAARDVPRVQRGIRGNRRAHRCTRHDLSGEAIVSGG